MSIVLPLAALAAFSLFSQKKGEKRPKQNAAKQLVSEARQTAAPLGDTGELEAILRNEVESIDRAAPEPAPREAIPTPRHAPRPIANTRPKPASVVLPATVIKVDQPVGIPDELGARRMAPSLAQHLSRAGRAGYDRRLVRTFQQKAGLTQDGIYGGSTRGALLYFGGSAAPAPFFPPLETIPFRGAK